MANTVNVRSYLQGKGVQSGDIGYDQNSGNVTVRGQNFYKPELNMAGTTFGNQQGLDSAYGAYSKALPVIAAPGSTTTTAPSSTTGSGGTTAGNTGASTGTGQAKPDTSSYTNPYTSIIADVMKHINDTYNAPAQDIYSSPQYAAAQAAQARTSQDAIRQANESAAGAGLGHSTIMTDRSQKIQDDSNNYLATQLVPQIQSQLAAQKQQDIQNQRSQLSDYMNLGQQADSQHNSDRTFDYNQGQDAIKNNQTAANDNATQTGNYISPEASALLQKQKENSDAYATATPEQQAILHQNNLDIAKQLGESFNPKTGQYIGGNYSSRTIAGQTLDLNNAKDMATLTGYMSDGKGGYVPTSEKQKQDLADAWTATNNLGSVTKSLSTLTGIPEGTPTEKAKNDAQQIAISQQTANNGTISASASSKNADTSAGELQYKKDHPAAATNPPPNKSDVESTYVSGLDSLTPEKQKEVFKKEKQSIVKDLGISGYNTLYGMYFDSSGNPTSQK